VPDDPKPSGDAGEDDLSDLAKQFGDALIDAEHEAEGDATEPDGAAEFQADLGDALNDDPVKPFGAIDQPLTDARVRSTIGDADPPLYSKDNRFGLTVQWRHFEDDTPIANVGERVREFRRFRFGRATPPFKTGPFDDDDGCLRGCFYPLGCFGFSLLVLFILIVAAIVILSGGGSDDADLVSGGGVEVSPTAAASAGASPAASASAAATEAPTEEPTETPLERTILQIGNTVIDEIWWELYVTTDLPAFVIDEIADSLEDLIDSISGRNPTYRSPYFDIRRSLASRLRFTAPGIHEAYGQTIYECGDSTDVRTVVCPSGVQPMPVGGGDVWMFAMSMDGEVPQASPDRSFIYSIVFDSDGEAANDWVFFPPFDFDLFRDSDRWYQLVWDHNSQVWFLTVTQIDANQVQGPFESAVRAVIQGDTVIFFIPASEFGLDQPPYRMTAFGHDGSFSESDRGADVTGVDPTEALTVPPADVLLAMPEDRAAP